MKKLAKWGGIALAALLLLAIGASLGDSGDPQEPRDDEQAARQAPGRETPEPADTPEPEPPPVPEPDATYKLSCDYLLGDFGESGDPAAGYRFVGGGSLQNTGNIGIKAQVVFRWEQLGTRPITEKKIVQVPTGKSRRVNVTVPVSADQIDLHQSAEGECSSRATIVGTFGRARD